MPATTQEWTHELTMMQQSVLLAAIRGADTLSKYNPGKYLLRWYRRCVLLSALDGRVLTDPVETVGGSFTGPSVQKFGYVFAPIGIEGNDRTYTNWTAALEALVDQYIATLDEVPHHYQLHFMHAIEILGYKHPDMAIREFWRGTYFRLALDMHLHPETEDELDFRLGDSRQQWLATADPATRS